MSTNLIVNDPVSIWQRAGLLGLIAAFLGMATMRLNDCDLFNPDSPRYVIYSQAIVDLGEYRATDLPGSPLYSWRPPGLSLLLAPMMAIRPYDVIAAKYVIVACGVLLISFVFLYASLFCGRWPAILMTSVVASSPAFLVLSTEVLSEIPYTLGVLVVLYFLSESEVSEFRRSVVRSPLSGFAILGIATVVLAFTPWLRTAGVSLVVAVGAWSLVRRARWKWLAAVVCAMSGLAMLAWRNKQASGENYVGSLFTRAREQGLLAIVISGLETVAHYVSTAPSLLLPGLTTQRSMYAPLTLDGLPNLGMSHGLQASIAAVIGIVAIIGMWRQRSGGGSLALLYLFVYCGCLVVWPWRHERFLWPLIPVVLAYVPAGATSLASGFGIVGRGIWLSGATCLLALCFWQTTIGGQVVGVNREFVAHRDAFHTTKYPGFYFSNWRRWTVVTRQFPGHNSRVLTWHAAVAGTSRRFQKRVQFELVPDKLRQQIEQFSARYLVVPDAQFGDGFGWHQLAADPGMTLNIVYREQDVAVLEVTPNRTGEVSAAAYPEWLEQQMKLIALARRQMPDRIDLAIRQASLLHESGDDEEAMRILHGLFDRGVVTVRVCAELGWMHYDAGEFAEAARFLDMARTLPNAESIANVLAEGAACARQRLQEHESSKSRPPVERQLRRVKALMAALKWAAAARMADQMLAENSENPEANFVRGKLHHVLGELRQAEACYDKALRLGFTEAQEWLFLIRFNAVMARSEKSTFDVGGVHHEADPASVNDHALLAKVLREHGWTGRALAILEEANRRFPGKPSIQRPLADLYRLFARPELAVPLCESILQTSADDEEAKKGLTAAQRMLMIPDMPPQAVRPRRMTGYE